MSSDELKVPSFDAAPVRHAYAAIAEEYAARHGDVLDQSAFDRAVLDNAVANSVPSSVLMDLGCGPGQIASYLRGRSCDAVVGVDITPEMLVVARAQFGALPLPLVNGNVLSLPFRKGACGGVVAWYALHNLPRAFIGDAFAEVRRVLRTGGVFVVATHEGDGEEVVESQRDGDGDVERVVITYYRGDELASVAAQEGFEVRSVRSRPPMRHEHQVMKLYVTCAATAP